MHFKEIISYLRECIAFYKQQYDGSDQRSLVSVRNFITPISFKNISGSLCWINKNERSCR